VLEDSLVDASIEPVDASAPLEEAVVSFEVSDAESELVVDADPDAESELVVDAAPDASPSVVSTIGVSVSLPHAAAKHSTHAICPVRMAPPTDDRWRGYTQRKDYVDHAALERHTPSSADNSSYGGDALIW
jgi:hypothetical protein